MSRLDRRGALTRLARAATLSLAAGALSAAAGCGFRLRGPVTLPFDTLWTNFAPGSALGASFRRALRAHTSTQIVDRPEQAAARLEVLGEVQERQVVAFSPTGRAREYQLLTRLNFRVVGADGRVLLEPAEIVQRRDISASDTDLTSKQQEEALLYRDMQLDLAQQLLRRLSSIGSRADPVAPR